MVGVAQELLINFEKQISELVACKDNGYVLVFDCGLGVKFNEEGNPRACRIQDADVVANNKMPEEAWAYVPSVQDGAGRKAKVMRRQDAIRREIAVLNDCINNLKVA